MKKFFWIVMAICAVMLTGCEKSEGNDLVKIPENTWSSLDMYYYNGERVAKGSISDETVKAEIFSVLAAVPAKKAENWSPADVRFPVYGVKFGFGDDSFEAAWSDGYWITKTGEVYSFNYDFAALWEGYEWENKSYGYSLGTVLPCSYYLCRDENGWIADYLPPAGNLPAMPKALTASVSKLDGDVLTVEFTNSGEEEWSFGEAFKLQAQLDGEWYSIPTLPGDWAWIALGYLVMPQQTLTHDYDLSIYGTLPEGNYRIVTDNFSAEFYIDNSEETTYFYQNENGEWIAEALEAAGAPPAMDGISAIVAAQDENSLTVRLTNWGYKYGDEDFRYGAPYHVEVFLGKRWYVVPTKDIDFGFFMPLYGISNGETKELFYDFSMYDTFPEGRYRVVNDGEFWAEFTAGETITPKNDLANDVVRSVTISYYDEYIDGSNSVIMEYIDKNSEISEILSIISAEPAEKVDNWSGSMVKAPIFGISAADARGWVFEGAWSNGYWIDQNGEAYRLDLDIEQLKRRIVQYEGSKTTHKNGSIAWLPCGTHLCKDENGWIANHMEPAAELSEPPENVTAEITELTSESVTIRCTNNGDTKWVYGSDCRVDVLIDGEWYKVPTKPGNWVSNCIAYNLPAGESREEKYYLAEYESFPIGTYRINTNDLIIEFHT